MHGAKKKSGWGGGGGLSRAERRRRAVQVRGHLELGVIPQKKVQYFLTSYDFQWPQQGTGYSRIRN
jgi:hypothetical protein